MSPSRWLVVSRPMGADSDRDRLEAAITSVRRRLLAQMSPAELDARLQATAAELRVIKRGG